MSVQTQHSNVSFAVQTDDKKIQMINQNIQTNLLNKLFKTIETQTINIIYNEIETMTDVLVKNASDIETMTIITPLIVKFYYFFYNILFFCFRMLICKRKKVKPLMKKHR